MPAEYQQCHFLYPIDPAARQCPGTSVVGLVPSPGQLDSMAALAEPMERNRVWFVGEREIQIFTLNERVQFLVVLQAVIQLTD